MFSSIDFRYRGFFFIDGAASMPFGRIDDDFRCLPLPEVRVPFLSASQHWLFSWCDFDFISSIFAISADWFSSALYAFRFSCHFDYVMWGFFIDVRDYFLHDIIDFFFFSPPYFHVEFLSMPHFSAKINIFFVLLFDAWCASSQHWFAGCISTFLSMPFSRAFISISRNIDYFR